MKRIWMSDRTMQRLADAVPSGETPCPRCGGAGEMILGSWPHYRTEQCRRCRGNGTVRA